MPPKRRVLALLNPFGGRGLGPSIWEKAKTSIFDKAKHLEVTLKHTERARHAYDIAKDELQVGQWDCIVCISGDGLIHEVINGIMNRPDKDEFLQRTTISFIPAGTANGLVASLIDALGETGDDVLTSAFLIAKGRRSLMDLQECRLEYFQGLPDGDPRKAIYMFLSLTWAFIADVDIHSESLRCLGSARFEVYGVYRVLNVQHYGGKIKFNGARALTKYIEEAPQAGQFQDNVVEDTFTYLNIMNVTHAGKGHKFAPIAQFDDGAADI